MVLRSRLAALPFMLKVLFLLGVILISISVSTGIYGIGYLWSTGSENLLQSVGSMRIVQWLQSLFGLLLPALIAAYLFSPSMLKYLSLNNGVQFRLMGWSVLAYLFFMPVLNVVVSWNERIQLPDFLNGVETWMKTMEENSRAVMEQMLATDSMGGLLLNLLLIAVVTGICEELLFRGVVQRLFYDRYKNVHIAVWATAFIFSAIHVQFYGFFPRLLMGAFFGYMLAWSGSIYVPIVLHIFNNALVVVSDDWVKRGLVESNTIETIGTNSETYIYAVLGGILTIVAISYIYRSATKLYQPTAV